MTDAKHQNIIKFIRDLYQSPKDMIPLHAPVFSGNEKKYLNECIDTTFVSSVGEFVDRFEEMTAEYTGAKYAVAAVNGTAALQAALRLVGVEQKDLVITQALTFVATANAIKHAGGEPVFLDVDKDTLGLSPEAVRMWLEENTFRKAEGNEKQENTYYKGTKQKVSACVPMHTFGHPCRIEEIVEVCKEYNIAVVEDAAESLGSFYKGKHTGTFGDIGIFSYNGNKTITTGGGGMIVTDNEKNAKLAKHLTTTAKVPHTYDYRHDYTAYNFRLTNLAAALGVAQMEKLDEYLTLKRKVAESYLEYFKNFEHIHAIAEPTDAKSNYWLNAILFDNKEEKQKFLGYSNDHGVMTRPIWILMTELEMYKDSISDELVNSKYLSDRIVNVPSSVKY
jgi:aminotransferase in exopolysaccharide biosynthesis